MITIIHRYVPIIISAYNIIIFITIHLLYGEYNTIYIGTPNRWYIMYIRPKTALNAHATIFGLPAGTKHVRDPLLRVIWHHIISCTPERDRLPRRIRSSGTCKSTALFVARVIRVRPDDGGRACRRGVPLAVRICCNNNIYYYYYYDTLKPTHHDSLTAHPPPSPFAVHTCPYNTSREYTVTKYWYTRCVVYTHIYIYIGNRFT